MLEPCDRCSTSISSWRSIHFPWTSSADCTASAAFFVAARTFTTNSSPFPGKSSPHKWDRRRMSPARDFRTDVLILSRPKENVPFDSSVLFLTRLLSPRSTVSFNLNSRLEIFNSNSDLSLDNLEAVSSESRICFACKLSCAWIAYSAFRCASSAALLAASTSSREAANASLAEAISFNMFVMRWLESLCVVWVLCASCKDNVVSLSCFSRSRHLLLASNNSRSISSMRALSWLIWRVCPPASTTFASFCRKLSSRSAIFSFIV
mmetsp:Transcript_17422/g.27961  ORF Transcript_17422/g.27961 Transcript_17422/m.27961 type:complete len:264 (+) Transcript_17422:935-1726(+)